MQRDFPKFRRVERDDAGPQVEVEYWKSRAAKLTLLTEQITSLPCKMTLVTLRAGNCKLLKVNDQFQPDKENKR